jgi:hypothetical protein
MDLLLICVIFGASFYSAYVCSRRVVRFPPGPAFLLALPILWVLWLIVPVQALAVLQLAGAIQKVSVGKIATVELGIVVAIALLGRFLGRFSFSALPTDAARLAISKSNETLPAYLKMSSGILAGSYLLFAIATVTSYPDGSDALGYHLPLALRWLQEGSLRIPEFKAWRASMPGNAEILMMLMLATGRQALVAAGNWISLGVLLISAYALARRFSDERRVAAYSIVLVVLSIPVIEFQTFSAYVDLFGTAFILAAFALFMYRDSPQYGAEQSTLSVAAIGLSAIACGLSVGTKLTFCAYGAVYFVAAAATLWREREIHRKPMPMLLGLLVGGMLLPSVFWYGREFQATGNPLYPSRVAIGARVIFPGVDSFQPAPETRLLADNTFTSNEGDREFVRRPTEWWIYPWTEWVRNAGDFPTAYGEAAGLGGAFATFAVVAVAYGCFLAFQNSTPRRMKTELRWSLLICLILLLAWIFALHRLVRFGLPIWVFFCVLAAPAINLLWKNYPRVLSVLFVASILTTCGISSLVPLHRLAGNVMARRWSRAAIYAYPSFIDSLPPGSCLLNDSRFPEKNFVLAGKHLSNRVVDAYEAPRELTQSFIASRRIDYVVRIAVDDHGADAVPLLPVSLAGTEVVQYVQAGRVWSIWKVNPRGESASGVNHPD